MYFYEFKLDKFAAAIARNNNAVCGEGNTTECTVWRQFQRFCGGVMSLKVKEGRVHPSEVDDHLLKAIIKDDQLRTTREVAHGLVIDYSTISMCDFR
ncbi:hypothetical protein RB195_025039 [Necator americanus]|uniref:Mos1 transposase HTH domain-containing protein n=1 Tax=Necator americanus TaxID=51031 RepID=A0ABR1EQL3_NECAM